MRHLPKDAFFHPSYTVCVDRCGSVGKLTRIAAAVVDPTFSEAHPRKSPSAPFLVLGGYADIITSSAFVHGHGAITGLANIAPVGSFLAFSAETDRPLACSSEVV